MNRKTSIALLYTGVVIFCIAILCVVAYIRPTLTSTYTAPVVNTGKETPPDWFEIGKDLSAINQDGTPVKLSDSAAKSGSPPNFSPSAHIAPCEMARNYGKFMMNSASTRISTSCAFP